MLHSARSRQITLPALIAALALTGCSSLDSQVNISPTTTARTQAVTSLTYVDCSSATNGSGTQTSPWNSLTGPNNTTYGPYGWVLLKRGTTCYGQLWPKGSGASGQQAGIGYYGSSGGLPIIDGGSSSSAIRLFNQHHWTVENIETRGGNPDGVKIGGDTANTTFAGFRITNLIAHDVGGTPTSKDTGIIEVGPTWGSSAKFDDVIIDGAQAHHSAQWMGIHISCSGNSNFAGNANSIIIRNSATWTVGGDGITIFGCNNGLIEKNVAADVGKITTGGIGTPNAIWTWACKDCTVQYNEGYDVHSPGVDGGVYDIDWNTTNGLVQYNYGHDADGYCASVFGAENYTTVNATIRYNVCANNGRGQGQVGQGDFNLATWNGGKIDGVRIYNNTSYWNPISNQPVLVNQGTVFTGSRERMFKNNILVSTVDKLIWTDNTLTLNNNLYWYTNGSSPSWGYGGGWWNSFAGYKSATGQDAQGKQADPLLNSPTYHAAGKPTTQFTLQSGSPAINTGANVGSMGAQDFFGTGIPQGGSYDIGAAEFK